MPKEIDEKAAVCWRLESLLPKSKSKILGG
jgi:hypothetical protein